MSKKKMMLLFLAMILISVCFITLKAYGRHTYRGLQLSFSEKKEFGKIISKYDCFSLDCMAYTPNKKCYRIYCNYNKSEINEEIFNKGVALYNEIMDYSGRNNSIFYGEKLELTIRNDSGLDYLILRNYAENASNANQNECGYVTLGYYIDKIHKVCTSDIDSFMEEYASEIFK